MRCKSPSEKALGLKFKFYAFYDISPCISPYEMNPMRRVVYLAHFDILFILEVFMEVLDTYAKSTGR